MDQTTRQPKARSNRSGVKRKVKSGCHTCRTRKVKCDETFPICHRCISTGRTCDGYGIWGGGADGGSTGVGCSVIHTRPRPTQQPAHVKPGYGSITGPLYSPYCHYPFLLDAADKARFEWFRQRSAPKLPGTFVTGFWTKLIFQAASTEPSILHAILALGTVHRRPALGDDAASAQEVVTLRHYTKAIGHLQHHLTAKGRASLHVSLIACVVFICLELLRGHFEMAQRHMDNGLKVLAEAQESLLTGDKAVPGVHQPRARMLDGWIVEMFLRLRLQFRLFHQGCPHPCMDYTAALSTPLPFYRFHSTNEAWKYLGQLLDKAMQIANEAHRQDDPGSAFLISAADLQERQQRNQTDLAHWLELYKASRDTIRAETPRETERIKLYLLILQYYNMAEIMTATCVCPTDESAYDLHTNRFISLIENSIALLKTSPDIKNQKSLSTPFLDSCLSIIDMGWNPPLYYTAIKCRVHRIRHQAMRLLSTSQHQEGIWDSKTSLCVARKVVELEERDFYHGLLSDADEFSLLSCPKEEDLSLPILPSSYRIHGVETSLQGEPLEMVSLTCSQKQDRADRIVFMGEYSVTSQSWGSINRDLTSLVI